VDIANSRVVITGGAGFIGSHMVDILLSRNNEVIVIDNFSTGSWRNLEDHKNNTLLHVVVADIRDESEISKCIRGADFVFHLACQNVRLSLRQPTIVHEVNTTGTLNVLKASVAGKVRRFLYCSSSEVNGTASIVPMTEEYHYRPETIYGASKLAGEYYTQVFHRAGWLPSIIARPHNNYGPREHYEGCKGEVIPRFILCALSGKSMAIYGDGSQTRDFTYVTETASFMIKLLECDDALGETYNVCRGEEVSILRIAEIISEIIGVDKPYLRLKGRPSDVLRLYGDSTKLERALGSIPQISIRDGLKKTISWFRENVPVDKNVFASLQYENWETVEQESFLKDL
jgi:UDP-glucose 4-epimerase